jgi:hypothetical protein
LPRALRHFQRRAATGLGTLAEFAREQAIDRVSVIGLGLLTDLVLVTDPALVASQALVTGLGLLTDRVWATDLGLVTCPE